MIFLPRARRFAPLFALLAISSIADAAPVRRARAPAPVAKPAATNSDIIALPLKPIVPAAQRLCTARTPAGLGYTMLRPGTGAKPGADATALINYIGYLAASGATFDQNMQTLAAR